MRRTKGRITYDGELENDEDDDDDEEEYEYIYREPRQRRREVVLRTSGPAKQRLVYQYKQVHPQYVYVYDGEEEYEDGELYYAPAPPPALARRPAPPNTQPMSFHVPNTNADVTITLTEAASLPLPLRPRPHRPPIRCTLARPTPAERVVYVPEPSEPAPRRVRTSAPLIYEVDDDGYTIAGDDEYDNVSVIARPVPKGRVYIGK